MPVGGERPHVKHASSRLSGEETEMTRKLSSFVVPAVIVVGILGLLGVGAVFLRGLCTNPATNPLCGLSGSTQPKPLPYILWIHPETKEIDPRCGEPCTPGSNELYRTSQSRMGLLADSMWDNYQIWVDAASSATQTRRIARRDAPAPPWGAAMCAGRLSVDPHPLPAAMPPAVWMPTVAYNSCVRLSTAVPSASTPPVRVENTHLEVGSRATVATLQIPQPVIEADSCALDFDGNYYCRGLDAGHPAF